MKLVCGVCGKSWVILNKEEGRKEWWCTYCGAFLEITKPLKEVNCETSGKVETTE